jgi:hypothetical protein
MRIPTRKIGSPNACERHRRAHVCARARAGACEYGRPRNPRRTCERFPSASTASSFGSQAFDNANAFNANIGAWNTAAVSYLSNVCAAFGPGGAPLRGDGARPVFDAARALNAHLYIHRGTRSEACTAACVRLCVHATALLHVRMWTYRRVGTIPIRAHHLAHPSRRMYVYRHMYRCISYILVELGA